MFEHTNGSFLLNIEAGVVEIVSIDNFFDAGLDDSFGTFDAREEMNIDASPLEFAHIATKIKNSIEFAVTDVGIFGVIVILGFTDVPRHHIIGKIIRCAIIADGKYAIVIAGDASADLSVGVFATH